MSGLKETLPNADKMAGVPQLGGGRPALVLNAAEVTGGSAAVMDKGRC